MLSSVFIGIFCAIFTKEHHNDILQKSKNKQICLMLSSFIYMHFQQKSAVLSLMKAPHNRFCLQF